MKSHSLIGACLAGCLAASLGTAQAPPRDVTLVLHIAVDQLRPDYLTKWESQFTGGFARILRDGAVFTNAFQDHANTETAPGHAAMLSGRFPYSTGIIANALGVETSTAPLVGYAGIGASPFRFRGTTLADWLIARDVGTRVLSVARKDRAAILPIAPAHRHTVLWYAPRAGRFTTSAWYADAVPAWVADFNRERGVLGLAGRAWNLLLPESQYPEPDSVVGEARTDLMFPHILPTDSAQLVTAVERTPWMDSLTLALALRGVRAMQLGSNPSRTDLLSVSLSSTDAIGHRWGPDSREVHDQILRVDRMLGAFLDSVFTVVPRSRILISLTSDHGVAPMAEVRSQFEDNGTAARISTAQFRTTVGAARAALRAAGLDTTALIWEDLVLSLDRHKLNTVPFDAGPLVWEFAASARQLQGVLRVDVIDDLVRADTTADAIARRMIRMFRPGQESSPGIVPLLTVTMRPYVTSPSTDAATHGTPHDYDARVPVAFMGSRVKAGRWTTKVNVVDIAPTLAALLGVTPLERLDGRTLREVIR